MTRGTWIFLGIAAVVGAVAIGMGPGEPEADKMSGTYISEKGTATWEITPVPKPSATGTIGVAYMFSFMINGSKSGGGPFGTIAQAKTAMVVAIKRALGENGKESAGTPTMGGLQFHTVQTATEGAGS